MTIRCRPMRRRDVSACVRILAAHPVAGPRYGESIDQLQSTWLRLLGRKAFWPVVLKSYTKPKSRWWEPQPACSLPTIFFVS